MDVQVDDDDEEEETKAEPTKTEPTVSSEATGEADPSVETESRVKTEPTKG